MNTQMVFYDSVNQELYYGSKRISETLLGGVRIISGCAATSFWRKLYPMEYLEFNELEGAKIPLHTIREMRKHIENFIGKYKRRS